MNKWIGVALAVLCIFAGIWSQMLPEKQQNVAPFGATSLPVKMYDNKEFRALICALGGKQGDFLVCVFDTGEYENAPSVNTGSGNEKPVLSIMTGPVTNRKEHIPVKNSIYYVDKNDVIVPLYTISDEQLAQALGHLQFSDDDEEKNLASLLFETVIRYAYEKKFPSEKHSEPVKE